MTTKKVLFFRVFMGLLCCSALYGQAEQVTPQQSTQEQQLLKLEQQLKLIEDGQARARIEQQDTLRRMSEVGAEALRQQESNHRVTIQKYVDNAATTRSEIQKLRDSIRRQAEEAEKSAQLRNRIVMGLLGFAVIYGADRILRPRKRKRLQTLEDNSASVVQIDATIHAQPTKVTYMLPIDPEPKQIQMYWDLCDPKPKDLEVTVVIREGQVRGKVFEDSHGALVIQFPHTNPTTLHNRKRAAAESFAAQLRQQSS